MGTGASQLNAYFWPPKITASLALSVKTGISKRISSPPSTLKSVKVIEKEIETRRVQFRAGPGDPSSEWRASLSHVISLVGKIIHWPPLPGMVWSLYIVRWAKTALFWQKGHTSMCGASEEGMKVRRKTVHLQERE